MASAATGIDTASPCTRLSCRSDRPMSALAYSCTVPNRPRVAAPLIRVRARSDSAPRVRAPPAGRTPVAAASADTDVVRAEVGLEQVADRAVEVGVHGG